MQGVAPTMHIGGFGRRYFVIGLLLDECLDLLELGVTLLIPWRPYLVVEPRPLGPRHVPVDVLVVVELVPVSRRLHLGEVSQVEQIMCHGRPPCLGPSLRRQAPGWLVRAAPLS